MFNKLKVKAGQPLTYGWLWKCYVYEAIAVGIIYGGMYIYGRITEKKANEKAEVVEDIVNYKKFEETED